MDAGGWGCHAIPNLGRSWTKDALKSAAEVLEECPYGTGATPTAKPGWVAAARQEGEAMGEGIRRDVEEVREADGLGVRDLDAARLHGPATDAVVRILGAVSRDGRGASGMMPARNVSGLGCPADEGAGQDEDSQERAQEHSHRKGPVLKGSLPIFKS